MIAEELRSEDSIILSVDGIRLDFMGIKKVTIIESSSKEFTIVLRFNFGDAKITIDCSYYELAHGDKVKVDYYG